MHILHLLFPLPQSVCQSLVLVCHINQFLLALLNLLLPLLVDSLTQFQVVLLLVQLLDIRLLFSHLLVQLADTILQVSRMHSALVLRARQLR